MKQQESKRNSLGVALGRAGALHDRSVNTAEGEIALSELVAGSALYGRGDELEGRSVLIVTRDQLTTAAVLMELDGTVQRMVLCPPELALEHIPFIVEAAGIDAIVSDGPGLNVRKPGSFYFSPCSRNISLGQSRSEVQYETEWVLLTSGTSGAPKVVVHTLKSLTGAIREDDGISENIVWSTFYDIRRYGGLQIFLRAMLNGTSLVLTSHSESTADFLVRAAAHGVTHISGTPSHWRRALMSSAASALHPAYVRLSGEIADHAVLNQLRSTYRDAKIVHAFASTEAGVAFEVHDGHAGFPASALTANSDVEMDVESGTLRIRSERTASRYLGEQAPILKDADGFVDTGDMVELRDGRYYFTGRADGVINVGGQKVYPEEIEAVINRHPEVSMSLVRSKRSPITGALVVADVVLKTEAHATGHHLSRIRADILLLCREALASHKVPAAINVVSSLAVADSGKVMRRDA